MISSFVFHLSTETRRGISKLLFRRLRISCQRANRQLRYSPQFQKRKKEKKNFCIRFLFCAPHIVQTLTPSDSGCEACSQSKSNRLSKKRRVCSQLSFVLKKGGNRNKI